MDGWSFRGQQLQEPSLAAVPLVCMSAAADPELVENQLGLVCLRKPLDLEAVLTALASAPRAGESPGPRR